MLSLHWLKNFG